MPDILCSLNQVSPEPGTGYFAASNERTVFLCFDPVEGFIVFISDINHVRADSFFLYITNQQTGMDPLYRKQPDCRCRDKQLTYHVGYFDHPVNFRII